MIYSSPTTIKADNKWVKTCIKNFEETGQSGAHSPAGGILCHILNHCIENEIGFQLSYMPNGGYSLEKKDWASELKSEDIEGGDMEGSAFGDHLREDM